MCLSAPIEIDGQTQSPPASGKFAPMIPRPAREEWVVNSEYGQNTILAGPCDPRGLGVLT